MSHCLNVLVCKNQNNLSTLIDKGYYFAVEYGYAILSVDYEHPKAIKGNKTILSKRTLAKELKSLGVSEYASINTDYGFGENKQSASYTDFIHPDKKCNSINQALSLLKIRKKQNEIDLYDTIGLGKYRSNTDLMSDELKAKRENEKKLK